MELANSITHKKAKLPPRKEKVTMYSCGPTVYDRAHIGNLRSFILDDSIRRALTYLGNQLEAIMNITDVDDKTITASQKSYPNLEPKKALSKLSTHYEKLFVNDLDLVGVQTSLFKTVRATDHVDKMQDLTRRIHLAGFAYEREGSVYFDIAAYQKAGNKYGVLANIDFSPQPRVDSDEYDKKEARDFVLWKAVKEREPSWEFTFDGKNLPGRPGWHIECSAMAVEYLGQPFKLHTGGIDLKFPHHENEIAQSRAAAGKELAEIFVHYNHLYVEGEKMSKSLGNVFNLDDLLKHNFDPLAFRLLVLQAHYSSELNFTWASLEATQNFLANIRAWADLRFQTFKSRAQLETLVLGPYSTTEVQLFDDLNTPAVLGDLAKDIVYTDANIDQLTSEKTGTAETNRDRLLLSIRNYDAILGLSLGDRKDITEKQKKLIAQREKARQAKDFDSSDKLRKELAEQGLEIDDTPHGPRWRRI